MLADLIADVVTVTVAVSLAVMAGATLFGMMTGSIMVTGLLRPHPGAPVSLDRLQLVAVTALFAGGYLVAALGKAPGEPLPGIPAPLLLVLIGSHGAYLSVKYASVLGSARGR